MKKILGEERRAMLLKLLKSEGSPIKGTELAKRSNVSRQVIVTDIALLKAKNEPIIATSQGYIYFMNQEQQVLFEREIASIHSNEQAEEEMNILVDAGVTIKNVTVEHPIYGDLTASMMISSRYDVQQFIEKVAETDASLLMNLTEGAHLHTITADSQEKIELAISKLQSKGFLANLNE